MCLHVFKDCKVNVVKNTFNSWVIDFCEHCWQIMPFSCETAAESFQNCASKLKKCICVPLSKFIFCTQYHITVFFSIWLNVSPIQPFSQAWIKHLYLLKSKLHYSRILVVSYKAWCLNHNKWKHFANLFWGTHKKMLTISVYTALNTWFTNLFTQIREIPLTVVVKTGGYGIVGAGVNL